MANEFGTHVVRFADVEARNEWITTNYEMPHVSLTDAQTGIVEQVYYNERMTIPVNMHASVLAWIISCVADKMNDENYSYWYEIYIYLLTSLRLDFNTGSTSFARRELVPTVIWMDPSNDQDNPISITIHPQSVNGSAARNVFDGLDVSNPHATEVSYFTLGSVEIPYSYYCKEDHNASYAYVGISNNGPVNLSAMSGIEISLSGGSSSASTQTLQDSINYNIDNEMYIVTTMDLIEEEQDDPQDIDKYESTWLNVAPFIEDANDIMNGCCKVYSYYCMCPAVFLQD